MLQVIAASGLSRQTQARQRFCLQCHPTGHPRLRNNTGGAAYNIFFNPLFPPLIPFQVLYISALWCETDSVSDLGSHAQVDDI
jgi:hypothetical protein